MNRYQIIVKDLTGAEPEVAYEGGASIVLTLTDEGRFMASLRTEHERLILMLAGLIHHTTSAAAGGPPALVTLSEVMAVLAELQAGRGVAEPTRVQPRPGQS